MRKIAYLFGATLITLAGEQAYAAAPTLDDWVVTDTPTIDTNGAGTCYTGYTCGNAITGDGFYQRQVTDATGEDYFQTIITDKTETASATEAGITFSDESYVAMGVSSGIKDHSYISEPDTSTYDHGQDAETLFGFQPVEFKEQTTLFIGCPDGFTCGGIVFGTDFRQQEFTDGNNIWFQTLDINEQDAEIIKSDSSWDATPFHLITTKLDLHLKPGELLVRSLSDSLKSTPANLQLDRSLVDADDAYLEVNQQSAAEQKIYSTILDVEIELNSDNTTVPLVAQLNTPFNVPDGFDFQVRLLTQNGWTDFVSDSDNQILGAKKSTDGYCPYVNSPDYNHPFGIGDECIQILFSDNGSNDRYRNEDSVVRLTLGFVLTYEEAQTEDLDIKADDAASEQVAEPGSGGGGGFGFWTLLLLGFRYFSSREGSSLLKA